jgi:CDGSH-type Zn-finger protein
MMVTTNAASFCVHLWMRIYKEKSMARLVKMSKTDPYQVTVGGETKYICSCGLSATMPFCDGSHELAAFEEEGKLYWYDSAGNCTEIADTFPKIRGD